MLGLPQEILSDAAVAALRRAEEATASAKAAVAKAEASAATAPNATCTSTSADASEQSHVRGAELARSPPATPTRAAHRTVHRTAPPDASPSSFASPDLCLRIGEKPAPPTARTESRVNKRSVAEAGGCGRHASSKRRLPAADADDD